MKYPTSIKELIYVLPSFNHSHAPGTEFYDVEKAMVAKEIEETFSDTGEGKKKFEPFGELVLPYHKMGAIDTLDLFGLDELIIFSFYWANRGSYKKVADIGANIGLHSIIMDKCGFEIHAYEPDPEHFKILERNLKLNDVSRVEPFCVAVSSKAGQAEFIRVLGNTTGSHLTGSKPNPAGQLDKFMVEIKPITPIIEWADLLKIDAEGHEKEILLVTSSENWVNTDAIVEVGNETNAHAIFDHFNKLGINLFAQKVNWQKVSSFYQMPTSYRDGSLFITSSDKMQ